MSFSLNEVDAQAKKATRGAGYSWGVAEDAGKATVWLCAQGLDGVSELAELLRSAPDTDHCPLTQGTRFSDSALIAPSESRVLHRVTRPLLLLPFAAAAARQRNTAVAVAYEGGTAATDGVSLALQGRQLGAEADVTFAPYAAQVAPNPKVTRATPDPAAWDILADFAHRTYAPATEESRRLGAGASQTDTP